jgi:hypothetical protein
MLFMAQRVETSFVGRSAQLRELAICGVSITVTAAMLCRRERPATLKKSTAAGEWWSA